MLDLWLMVVMFLYLIEVPLSYYPAPSRFSPGWYSVRIFGFLSSSLVLIVLLYEIETLYARLLGAVLAQRREREARLMTGDAVAASIAHEVKQPLTAMVTSADAGFRFLDRSTPNLDRAKEAFKLIAADGHRAGEVVENIRANFRNDVRTRTSLDVNELIREALALERGDLEKHRILVQAEPNKQLPEVRGNRVQLQQVLLNLITNAIDAMAAKDEPRVLCVKSEAYEGDSVVVSVADTGAGVSRARYRSDIQPALHDQIRRHGDGTVDLPCDHRGPRWPVVVFPEHPRGAVFQFTLHADNPAPAACLISRSCNRDDAVTHRARREWVDRYLERPGHSHQLGKRSGTHLLHDLAAMNLDRDLADAQLGRGLFVEKAAHDQRQDLALARRQATKGADATPPARLSSAWRRDPARWRHGSPASGLPP